MQGLPLMCGLTELLKGIMYDLLKLVLDLGFGAAAYKMAKSATTKNVEQDTKLGDLVTVVGSHDRRIAAVELEGHRVQS